MKSKFKDIIQSETPTLVDFHAEWCGPCKMQSPILEEVKKEMGDQVRIIKIDIDKNPKLAEQLNVRGVPTLIVYKNGDQVWRESGLHQKEQLQTIIQQNS